MASCETCLERFRTKDLYCNFNTVMGVWKSAKTLKKQATTRVTIPEKAAAKSRGKKELKMGRCRNTLQQYYFPKHNE